jgi:hypothetical protein
VLTVRIRSYLARHRRAHWSLVAGLALMAGIIVMQQGQRLERARAAWGAPAEVWVVDGPVQPGAPLVGRLVTVPQAVVPVGALTLGPAPGAVAAQRLAQGEIITVDDVAGGPAGLVPAGWRSVAVAVDERSLQVAVGDPVDVAADGVLLVSGGRVVAVREMAVAVAVPTAVAAVVAAAALDGRAVLLGHGGAGG